MLPSALTYPLSGRRRPRSFLIGTVLSASGTLLLPAVLVAGYYGRVLRSAATGSETAPAFDDWGDLFVTGLQTWAITAAFYLLGFVGVVAFAALSLLLGLFETGAGGAVGAVAIVVGALFVFTIVWTPAWFFVPAAMANFAVEGRMEAAFDVRTVASVAFDPGYLRRWAAGFGAVVLGSGFYAVLAGFDFLPLFARSGASSQFAAASLLRHAVGAAINFYCLVVAARLFGRGYAVAVDAEPAAVEPTARPDRPDEDLAWGERARRDVRGEE